MPDPEYDAQGNVITADGGNNPEFDALGNVLSTGTASPSQKKSPGAMDYLKAAGQGFLDPFVGAVQGIAGAGNMLMHPIDTAAGVGNRMISEGKTAIQEAKAGNYWKAATAALMMNPIAPMVESYLNESKQNPVRAAGKYLLAPEIMGEAFNPSNYPASDAPQVAAEAQAHTNLMKALKPSKNDFQFKGNLQKAVPEVAQEAANQGRQVGSVQDIVNLIGPAKQRVWDRYMQFLGPNKAIGVIDGNPIADAIEKTITPKLAQENPAQAAAITKLADGYRRQIPLPESESFLQSANNDLDAFYKKNKVGRDTAAKDPAQAPNVAIADGFRKGIYDKLDSLSGPGARDIKKTYGALSSLENVARPRAVQVETMAPANLSDQINIPAAAAELGGGAAIGAMAGQPLAGVGAGLLTAGARMGLTAYLKSLNHPDVLAAKAFEVLGGKRSTLPEPTPRPIRGLLPRGPLTTPEYGYSAGSEGSRLSVNPADIAPVDQDWLIEQARKLRPELSPHQIMDILSSSREQAAGLAPTTTEPGLPTAPYIEKPRSFRP